MSTVLDAIRAAETAGPTVAQADPTAVNVLDAALRQFELFGIERSTVEDIAKRAGLARVTVYRRFPAKDRLVEAVILRELGRFLTDLDRVIEPIDDPAERVTEGFVFTLEAARSHPLLQRLLESEPETLLPHLTTEGAPFIGAARQFLLARLDRNAEAARSTDELEAVAEIVVRLILSFLLTPQAHVDLDDQEQARRFGRRYIEPILRGGNPRPTGG